jgi:hypothetical protein
MTSRTTTRIRTRVSVFEKGAARIVCVQDYGRARVPTDNGPDLGPWRGKIMFRLENLGLDGSRPLEVLAVDEAMDVAALGVSQSPGCIEIEREIDGFAEFVIGPVGATERLFFHG